MSKVHPPKKVRCYAEFKDGHWQAFCLDFTLAVQGDSLQEVKDKLNRQVVSYVRDALTIDAEHAEELFARRAPMTWYAKFHAMNAWFRLVERVRKITHHRTSNNKHQVFRCAVNAA